MRLQGYNIHTAVAEGQVILAARATSQATEHGQLDPMLQAAREHLAAAAIEGQITRVLADSGYWHAGQVKGLQDAGLDVLVCPRPWQPGSQVKPTNPIALAMADRLASEQGAQDYRRRQQIAEPVFAHSKHLRGITRLRRGKADVQAEIDLIAATHNLLKLYRTAPLAA